MVMVGSGEGVRLNVTTFCLRCAEITPSGMHLCPGCALPVFYPNFIPNADEEDFARSYIVPEWVRSMGQWTVQSQEDRFRSGRGHQEELDFLFDGIRPEVDGAQSGIRLPPYLGEDKGGVDVAWDEMAKVLFQFFYVSGISASDAFVEKWVAKHLIKTKSIDLSR